MHKIPVTVITGFLGAGKTTLLRNLLQNNQGRKIAVIVNEFGEIGIDGELLRSCQVCDDDGEMNSNIIELTNGCLCCTVQEEFYPTMQKLLTRKDQIDAIVIETSGLALPKPLIQAFKWQEIRNHATVDGVITVVDAYGLAKGNLVGDLEAINQQRLNDPSLDHETPIEELFEDQLACADLVLLTKTDLLKDDELTQVKNWLEKELHTGIKVIPCHQGEINSEILLGFNAAVEDDIINRPSHHDTEEEHDHDDDINCLELSMEETINPQVLISRLENLVKNLEIYRIKGFVNVTNKPMRMVLQGVGNHFETFYDRLWQPEEKRSTKLVIIGRNLKPSDLIMT
ncbi:MAG: cobalamin biosynthesis protein CobW [Cyanobacteria bacterium]|nr:cobalamin biosynthesis protein CobW [Cyanobacteria bacterium CG_2015-16_32_12]NCO79469.1 cobalamin biosynthesis protein CobW [Cyanobacteria bacterium CG_2015-22_32_23]NCQ05564.1 cobalamin biosynthesis protein CobW [Cyanobacteria bacterium CG_2015-09_32_10]NCQ42926.1 cobalamin biosynthesis protein CobW [Cyanobacteria bacterium CG_2015-04_32_10]NCS83983.1 cobalamin biosynthesis protein CobW [Cyanobacteria bacterium CG_2015-02_32_10]